MEVIYIISGILEPDWNSSYEDLNNTNILLCLELLLLSLDEMLSVIIQFLFFFSISFILIAVDIYCNYLDNNTAVFCISINWSSDTRHMISFLRKKKVCVLFFIFILFTKSYRIFGLNIFDKKQLELRWGNTKQKLIVILYWRKWRY